MTAHRFLTCADPDVTVVVFMRPDGSAEVAMSRVGRSTIVHVPKPPEGQRIVTKRLPSGEVEVLYEEIE